MGDLEYGWQQKRSLRDWLFHEPYRFEFYQAVRLLEAFQPKETEAIRFRSRVSFDFPASEVQDIEETPAGPRVTVNFLGLAGALGPLPPPYSEMVLEALAKKDRAPADFLDIFNNRLLKLLYRTRQVHHPALTALAPHEGSVARYLFSLIGLGLPEARKNLRIPARSLLYYSGLLARQPRTAVGLERIVADYFGVPVRVTQFVGLWRSLDSSQWTALGRTGRNQAIGGGAVLGQRVWDQGGSVALVIGPLSLEQFQQFLPGRSRHAELSELTRFYLGVERKAEARLLLRDDEIPPAVAGRSRLGYTSFLPRRLGSHAALGHSRHGHSSLFRRPFETPEPGVRVSLDK